MPLQRKNELKKLLDILQKRKPRVILETGTDKGGSFFTWCKQLPVERAIGIEPIGMPFDEVFRKYFTNVDFLFIEKATNEEGVFDTIELFLGGDSIDFVFLDGSKLYGIVKNDLDSLLPFMNKGGIIAIHDINPMNRAVPNGPQRLFEECTMGGFKTEAIIDFSEATPFINKDKKSKGNYEGWLKHWKDSSAGLGLVYMKE